MTISAMRDRAIDYMPCRYNGSRLWFRGPARRLDRPYLACLGGCTVYGRYLAEPMTDILAARLSWPVVNLGVENSGVDAYLNDPAALLTAARARIALVELSGGHNISNRFYTVHPRRNDRFLSASSALRALYPEMDFTEVHFTRHLLSSLHRLCPERFRDVVSELRTAWLSRMQRLIGSLSVEPVLFRFAPVALSDKGAGQALPEDVLDADTVNRLRPYALKIVDIVPPDWTAGKGQMIVPDLDAARLRGLPGPVAHRHAADALALALRPLLK